MWKNYIFTQEEIAIANRCSKSNGAVGAKALTPKYIMETTEKSSRILDFGCGHVAQYVQLLLAEGFNVVGYDYGKNNQTQYHKLDALNYQYDIVYASNVLNVQSTLNGLEATIMQIWEATKPNGRIVVNYAEKPRKLEGIETTDLEALITKLYGKAPVKVGGTKKGPLWEVQK